jgi:hypothetical protein
MTWIHPSNRPPAEEEVASASDGSPVLQQEYCFLSLWVLNPALKYSVTNTTNQAPSESLFKSATGILAMKMFWKSVDLAAADALIESEGVEEVFLPVETILEIEATLRDSVELLPPSARKFQDWNVGLLERFQQT